MISKAELRALLLEAYNLDGPRLAEGVVPPAEFAAMDDHNVNRWDFDKRWFMRKIARALSGRGETQ